jgi:hypothetical protein
MARWQPLRCSLGNRTKLLATATKCPYADPEKAAGNLLEIANSVEAVLDGNSGHQGCHLK